MIKIVLNDKQFAGKQTRCRNRDHRGANRFEIRPEMCCTFDGHDTRGCGVQFKMGELGKV